MSKFTGILANEGAIARSQIKGRGFTLIEMMVTAAIIAILASIALPSYQDSVRKGRRASAQGFLMDVAQRQQQFFIDNRAYAATLAALGVTMPEDVSDHYGLTIALTAGPPPGFLLTATATGGQAHDGDLGLDQTGNRTPASKW